jgi:hypothetical protein
MLTKGFDGTPSPTRTDMNRSSTDCESVALGLKPLITLTFIVSINVLYQCFFSKSVRIFQSLFCKIFTKLSIANFAKLTYQNQLTRNNH